MPHPHAATGADPGCADATSPVQRHDSTGKQYPGSVQMTVNAPLAPPLSSLLLHLHHSLLQAPLCVWAAPALTCCLLPVLLLVQGLVLVGRVFGLLLQQLQLVPSSPALWSAVSTLQDTDSMLSFRMINAKLPLSKSNSLPCWAPETCCQIIGVPGTMLSVHAEPCHKISARSKLPPKRHAQVYD